jgi:hypothetical protein
MFIVKYFWQNIDKHREVFEYNLFIAEKIQQENKNFSQCFQKELKGPGFSKAFVKFPF